MNNYSVYENDYWKDPTSQLLFFNFEINSLKSSTQPETIFNNTPTSTFQLQTTDTAKFITNLNCVLRAWLSIHNISICSIWGLKAKTHAWRTQQLDDKENTLAIVLPGTLHYTLLALCETHNESTEVLSAFWIFTNFKPPCLHTTVILLYKYHLKIYEIWSTKAAGSWPLVCRLNTCWNIHRSLQPGSSTLQGMSQRLMMIEQCFFNIFLKTLM